MKRKLTSILLAVVVLFSLCAPTFAANNMRHFFAPNPATKSSLTEGYVYVLGESSDPTFVKGSKATISFKRRVATPSSNDTFIVEIYKGTANQLYHGEELTRVERRSYNISKFTSPNYRLDMTISLDDRYPAGNYAVSWGIRSPAGKQYSGDYDYLMDMTVVSKEVAATGVELYSPEGTFNGIISVGETAVLLPALLPANTTTARKFTVSSSQSGVATATLKDGYIYLKGVAVGVTDIVVRCGKLEKKLTIGVGSLSDFSLSPGKTTLCVGTTDTIRTSATASESPIYYTWSSSDTSVATVKNGVVTAVKPGTVTISASCYFITRSVTYQVNYHQLPAGTPTSTRTATMPRQQVGHCSVCGKDNCVNVFEPAIFTDTVYNSWYSEHVDYVFENGLMNGVSDSKFAPGNPVTRGMVVTVLYRIAGQPEVSGSSPFSDVPAGKYYSNAVIWAQSEGVVAGFNDGKYHPDENVTREQLATILYRYSVAQGETIEGLANLNSFPDAGKVHNYAKEGMAWAVYEGLITGVGKDGKSYLQPANSATRAQFATIISRYLQR